MSTDAKIIIICVEGCHGSGKTAVMEEFDARGYRVLDEAFMDMPSYALPPQSLLMETSWVCSWFERVLRLANRVRREKTEAARQYVYIADRSPFSAVFYSRHGDLLEPVIREQMREVQEFSNVMFYTVNIQVEAELLWSRIQARLEREPERVRFNEHKRTWMEQTLDFYNTFHWDLHVKNDDRSIPEIADNIVSELSERDADFCEWNLRKKAQFSMCDSSFASTDSDEEVLHDIVGSSHGSDGSLSPIAETKKSQAHAIPSIISFNNCFDNLEF